MYPSHVTIPTAYTPPHTRIPPPTRTPTPTYTPLYTTKRTALDVSVPLDVTARCICTYSITARCICTYSITKFVNRYKTQVEVARPNRALSTPSSSAHMFSVRSKYTLVWKRLRAHFCLDNGLELA